MSQKRLRRFSGFFVLLAATGIVFAGGASTGLTPLTELGTGTHQGFQGGLYPGGLNTIPPAHLAAGIAQAAQVVPRIGTGAADPNGWIVMITVGFSNTVQESGAFERQEDINPARNGRVVIVNAAHSGLMTSGINTPSSWYWDLVDARLASLNLSAEQVQVAWVEGANANPANNFPTHAQALSSDLRGVAKALRIRYPNLRICYFSSRIYGGYSVGTPIEPQGYETAFSVKWLIEDQIGGQPDLNFDSAAGSVEAPWLAWGPYLWADGVIPRTADGLVWIQSDMESDTVHPSASAELKVAQMLSNSLATDSTATTWYAAKPDTDLQYVDAIADTYVSIAQPDQNYGGAGVLRTTVGGLDTDVLVKFDVRGVTQPILFAKLSLRVTPSEGAPDTHVQTVSDDSWSESLVTWNNAPAGGPSPIATTRTIARDGTVSADVTQAVSNDPDGIVSFRLSTPISAGSFSSREAGQPPRLILVVSQPGRAVPAASAWGLIACSLLLAIAGCVILRGRTRRLQGCNQPL